MPVALGYLHDFLYFTRDFLRLGMEALANLRKKIYVKDPFFIYKMNDEAMNGEQTFVFKMSRAQADLALAMDRSTDNYLQDEYCFGDGTFARVINFTTLGVHVYHPLLKQITRLATMQIPKPGGESADVWKLFWNMFNEV